MSLLGVNYDAVGWTKDCHFFANTVITRDPAPLARYQPAQSSG